MLFDFATWILASVSRETLQLVGPSCAELAAGKAPCAGPHQEVQLQITRH